MPNTRPTLIWRTFFSTLCGVLIHPSGNAEAEIYKGDRQKLEFWLNVQHSFANTEVWSPFVFFDFCHFNTLMLGTPTFHGSAE
jgi:hypothetical protein